MRGQPGSSARWGVAALAALAMHCEGGDRVGNTTAPETVVVPSGITTVATLGQGRDLVKEEMRAQCVRSASTVTLPLQEAHLRFDAAMTKQEASETLGFKAETKAKFKLVEASAKAKFSRSLTSSSFSIALFYAADYGNGYLRLDEGTLEWLVPDGDPDWLARCGDEFMYQKGVGGQLFLLYRIDFASLAAKQEFEGSFNLGVTPAVNVSGEVQRSSSSFFGRASVHVEAFQLGGDVTRLGAVVGGFTTEEGRTALDCTMTDLKPCANFMSKGVEYASAQGSGTFSDSLKTTPADRVYLFKDWTMLGVGAPPRWVGAEIKGARRSLEQRLDGQIEFEERVKVLQSGRIYVTPALRSQLGAYAQAASKNIALLVDAAKVCWDDITDPQDPVQVSACVQAASLGALVADGYDAGLTMDLLKVDARLPYVFGGMFQRDVYPINSLHRSYRHVPNPLTGTVGCPPGFLERQFGYSVGADGSPFSGNFSGDLRQYLCIAAEGTPGWSFTGAYQVAPSAGETVPNLFAGGFLGCPSGTGVAYHYGWVAVPSSPWVLAKQYFCSTGVSSPERMTIGGMYQVDECGRSSVANGLTGMLNCPEGFAPVLMARVRAPYSGCAANQYVCKVY